MKSFRRTRQSEAFFRSGTTTSDRVSVSRGLPERITRRLSGLDIRSCTIKCHSTFRFCSGKVIPYLPWSPPLLPRGRRDSVFRDSLFRLPIIIRILHSILVVLGICWLPGAVVSRTERLHHLLDDQRL